MRILFQGDSITDGNRYKDEEHRWDLNHQIGHSYAFIVNSLLGLKYPEMKLEFVNRGISGNTTRNLCERWQEDALDINPDLLSLLIGVNDCVHPVKTHVSVEEYESNLLKLLSLSFDRNPNLRVYLLEPFFLPTKDDFAQRSSFWRDEISKYSVVCRKIANADERIKFIGLQKIFDSACEQRECAYWIWDGIHPTECGHGLIAEEWIKAFETDFLK